jgi:hypothetical protein
MGDGHAGAILGDFGRRSRGGDWVTEPRMSAGVAPASWAGPLEECTRVEGAEGPEAGSTGGSP